VIPQYLWFQAYYPFFYVDGAEWFQNLESGSYTQAGQQKATLFTAQVANSSLDNNENYMEYIALYTAFYLGANISAPYEIQDCFNNEEAIPGVEFYTGWGYVVGNSSALTASVKTTAYFISSQSLLGQLAGVFACIDATSDQQRLNSEYGYDLLSSSFNTAVLKYVVMNPVTYYNIFSPIATAMSNNNFAEAGVLLARFYYDVAQAYPPSSHHGL